VGVNESSKCNPQQDIIDNEPNRIVKAAGEEEEKKRRRRKRRRKERKKRKKRKKTIQSLTGSRTIKE
jgi:hypothetical protein